MWASASAPLAQSRGPLLQVAQRPLPRTYPKRPSANSNSPFSQPKHITTSNQLPTLHNIHRSRYDHTQSIHTTADTSNLSTRALQSRASGPSLLPPARARSLAMASSSTTTTTTSPFPYASAPDIIRAHQKDAYFTGHLSNTLTDLHRRLAGARAAHAHAPELRSLAALLYLGLTTLPGSRTLGEEYCDLVHVHAATARPPALVPRAAYVAAAVLVPYLAARALPRLRSRLRRSLEARIDGLRARGKGKSRACRVLEYLARHLQAWTSPAPLHAVTLALFYFGGSYYELAKRLLGWRYVFTRAAPDTPDRAGYEVLGVLLAFQLGVQAYLHVRETLAGSPEQQQQLTHRARSPLAASGSVDVSLDHENSYSANNDLLVSDLTGLGPPTRIVDIALATHTPVSGKPRFHLGDDKVMAYIKGTQQRKCTLCLEELKDPSATQCGHVFCWECIGDWVREKPECPLCRREAMVQHILPLLVI